MDQMEYLRLNLGDWRGSFTQLSLAGEVQKDSPSTLTLLENPQSGAVDLELQVFDGVTGERSRHINLSFSSVGGTIPFFETGAFTQGSLQWSPVSSFGAEIAFVVGDRRHRQVTMYGAGAKVPNLTLIRELRHTCTAPEQPTLTVESLVGNWQGEAIVYAASGMELERLKTSLLLELEGDQLTQVTQFAGRELRSSATVEGNRLLFTEGSHPVQVCLLPDGGSTTIPAALPKDQGFFIEAGWMYAPGHRQRLVRRYNSGGGLEAVLLIHEHRQ